MHPSNSKEIIPDWCLAVLRCPLTREELHIAPPEVVRRLQALQSQGQLSNEIGATVTSDISAGLVNASGNRFILIEDGIPNFVPNETIPVPSFEAGQDLG